MRVTQKGKKPLEPWQGKWSCNHCHPPTKWELDETDSEPKFLSDPRPGESCWTMNCPVCGKQTTKGGAIPNYDSFYDR